MDQARDQGGRTQSLYRKYRPETFGETELVGQDHISRTLKNAIAQHRISHAYLFCGPRGTGKTTTARLLAKAVNCEHPDPDQRPCNECPSCKAINEGRTTDIIEIDAASNRGIEDIRDLREQVRYAPTQLRHKFYIIDEAHRLTRDAFNAFLKTLEEPPPNTTFVLATTDPDQLLETVASRCQRFDFHRIPVEKVMQRARDVCDQEGIKIDDDALLVVARHSTGSLRDALSLIDMLRTAIVGEDNAIDLDLTRRMLGLSHDERTLALIDAIADGDAAEGLRVIGNVVDSGQDVRSFSRQVVSALRMMLLLRAGVEQEEAGDDLRKMAGRFELADLVRVNQRFSEIDFAMRSGSSGFVQLPLELAFLAALYGDPEAVAVEAPKPVRTPPARPTASERQPTPVRSEPTRTEPPQRPAPKVDRSAPPRREPERTATPEPEPVRSSPPAGQTSAPTVSSATFAEIVNRWQEIRTEVKAIDRKTEALMASTDPANLTDNTLYLVAAYPFHASKLNDGSARVTIEQALERVIGTPLRVTTVLKGEIDEGGGQSPPPSSQPPTGSNGPQRRQPSPTRKAESASPEQPERNDAEADHDFSRVKALFDAEEIDPTELPPGLSTS